MITLTPSAQQRFQQLIDQQQARGIRLGVKKSGCAGLSYQIDLETEDHSSQKDWHRVDAGVTIWMHDSSRPFLEGMTVDWQTQGLNQRVLFLNPNQKTQCGCGESFGI